MSYSSSPQGEEAWKVRVRRTIRIVFKRMRIKHKIKLPCHSRGVPDKFSIR
jgi:hypothetical protein